MKTIQTSLMTLFLLITFAVCFTACQKDNLNPANVEALEEEPTDESTETQNKGKEESPILKSNANSCDQIVGFAPYNGFQFADISLDGIMTPNGLVSVTTYDLILLDDIIEAYDLSPNASINGENDFNQNLPIADIPFDVDGNGVTNAADNDRAFDIFLALRAVAPNNNVLDRDDVQCIRSLVLNITTCPCEPIDIPAPTGPGACANNLIDVAINCNGDLSITNISNQVTALKLFQGGNDLGWLCAPWSGNGPCGDFNLNFNQLQGNLSNYWIQVYTNGGTCNYNIN